MRTFTRGLPLLALWLPACGGLEQHEAAIIGGMKDIAHQAVVVVDLGGGYCSGTLIGRYVVLTAAHCADGLQPDAVRVHFGTDVFDAEGLVFGTTTLHVAEISVHPDYTDALSGGHDVALLRLAGPAPVQVAPIPPLPAALQVTRDDIGAAFTMVGYGRTDVHGPSQNVTRMQVTTALRWVCTDPAGCEEVLDGRWYTLLENTLCFEYAWGGTCYGDSGGPELMRRDGREYVAGVTSFGDTDCSAFSCHAKVDAYEAFIQDFAWELGHPCERDEQCLSGNCASAACAAEDLDYGCATAPGVRPDLPGLLGLLGLLGLALLRIRRRARPAR